MSVCVKRTTVILEDACMDGIRELARREGRQLSEVVNALLAEVAPLSGSEALVRVHMAMTADSGYAAGARA